MPPSASPYGTFSRRSLHGQIAHQIGARILSGELPPGTALPNEAEFSIELRISRTVLREAIKLLAAKGLVESRPKTGTKVRPSDQWNMLDPDILTWRLASGDIQGFADHLYEMRRIIEPQAAALAAERGSAADLAAITAALEAMAAATDVPESIGPDLAFHRAILAATGNQMLGALGVVIAAALTAGFQLSGSHPDAPRISIPDHSAVLDAIVARDPAAARDAMEALLGRASRNVAQALQDRRLPATVAPALVSPDLVAPTPAAPAAAPVQAPGRGAGARKDKR